MSGLVLRSLGPEKRMLVQEKNEWSDETIVGDRKRGGRGKGRNQGRPLHIIRYRVEAIRSQKGF